VLGLQLLHVSVSGSVAFTDLYQVLVGHLSTSRIPTIWPAKTLLRLILRRPMQMRPQLVTRRDLSWYGYSGSGGGW
jgi:hypothetical protein